MKSRIQNPEFRIRNSGSGIQYPEWGRTRSWTVSNSKPEPARRGARSFEELIVWQKAHRWVLQTYALSDAFPGSERFTLTSQLRRAAMSVPANIAEGFKKRGRRDKLRYYNVAQGSLEECRYFLILARDLGYADVQVALVGIEEASRLLDAYHKAILDSEF